VPASRNIRALSVLEYPRRVWHERCCLESSMRTSSSSSHSLGLLLRSSANTKLLTAEEEANLIRRAHAGDAKALDRLVAAHVRFVFSIADQYLRYGTPLDELVSEGLLGFMEGVRRFNPDRGVRLATYAALWIRALLRRYTLNNRRIVRPPSSRAARKVIGNLASARRRLTQQLGEEPDAVLLARALGVTTADVEEVEEIMGKRDVVCDGQNGAGAYDVPSSTPSPEALASESEAALRTSAAVARALLALEPRERLIVSQRTLEDDSPRKLGDIGAELGISRERVRQIQNHALEKMKHQLSAVA